MLRVIIMRVMWKVAFDMSCCGLYVCGKAGETQVVGGRYRYW